MRPGKVTGEDCSGWGSLLRIFFVLLAVFAVSAPSDSFATDRRVATTNGLFNLSLEQLVNINCATGALESEFGGGDLFVQSIQKAQRYSIETASAKRQVLRAADNISKKLDQIAPKDVVLFIDGYEVGNIRPSDVKDYVRELSDSLVQLELYSGNSSTWWSRAADEAVINFVTEKSGISALINQRRFTKHQKRLHFRREEP